MKFQQRVAVLWLGVVVGSSACGARSGAGAFPQAATIRAAEDTPSEFEVLTPYAGSAGGTCQSPLRDPRTGLQLRFVRTAPGLGDYAVPEGVYGARAGELLRIDCRSYKPVGLVAR